MRNTYELKQEEFDALLGLFSEDREEAGERYELVRQGLIRFFEFKGCADPISLTDETINRVAFKIGSFDRSRETKPVSYFYGFASNVLLEHKRVAMKETVLEESRYYAATSPAEIDAAETELTCMNKCLGSLGADERELIVEYYALEGKAKIELRQKLAERMKCGPAALYTRVFRVKSALRGCIEKCVGVGA